MLLSMCNSIADHTPTVDISVIHEFHGEHLLTIAMVPRVATLLPGKLKEMARGDCRPGWMLCFCC